MKQGWAHPGIWEMMEPQLGVVAGVQVDVVVGGQDVVGGGELEPLPEPVDAEVVVDVGVALLPEGMVLEDVEDDDADVAVATLSRTLVI